MTKASRAALEECRRAKKEANSIREGLEDINRTLYSIGAPRYGMPFEHGGAPTFRVETLLDKKDERLTRYAAALGAAMDAAAAAETEIAKIQHPEARAAMRYYYVIGLPCWEVVAERLDRDVRTLLRWKESFTA